MAAALAVAALPATAATKSYSYRVELAGAARKSQVRAGNVDWKCGGKYCVASARGGNVSVHGCSELASQVGRIVSYRSEIKQLEAEDLEACNAAGASQKSPPERAPTAAAASPTAAMQSPSPSRVTTEELTFTGVHKWSPAR